MEFLNYGEDYPIINLQDTIAISKYGAASISFTHTAKSGTTAHLAHITWDFETIEERDRVFRQIMTRFSTRL